MDTAIWPRIASIWPSGQHFEAEVDRLHEEDDVVEVEVRMRALSTSPRHWIVKDSRCCPHRFGPRF